MSSRRLETKTLVSRTTSLKHTFANRLLKLTYSILEFQNFPGENPGPPPLQGKGREGEGREEEGKGKGRREGKDREGTGTGEGRMEGGKE